MAIAGTAAFNPDQADLFEEAFEIAGVEFTSGNDVRTARRSLNYLTVEWSNDGINLWTITEGEIAMVAGTAEYELPIEMIALLDAVIRTDSGASPPSTEQMDIICRPMSATSYQQIPAKLQQGRPNRFWSDRKGIRDTGVAPTPDRANTLYVWPVPDLSSTYTFVYNYTKRMSDAGTSLDNTLEIPDRFLSAMVLGVAYKVALKKNPAKAPALFAEYTRVYEAAKEEDRTKEDFRIHPDMSGYSF